MRGDWKLPAALAVLFLWAEAWQTLLPVLQNPDALPYPHLPTDHAAYLSFVRQAAEGGGPWSRNLFTTEAQDGRFLMLTLGLVGWIHRLTSLPVPWAWHLVRLAGAAGVVLALGGLIRALFPSRGQRLFAFALVLFGGGLDVWVRWGASLDLWGDPGLSSWARNPWNFSLFWNGAVLVWTWPLWILLAWIAREIRTGGEAGPGTWLVRGALFALLFAMHPYTAIFQGLLVAFIALKDLPGTMQSDSPAGAILRRLPVLAGPAAVALFLVWARGDPVYRWSTDQVGLWRLSYPPHLWPLACGPQVLLALAGLGRDREGERGFCWIRAWALFGVLATANPLITGAKFQPLMIVPLGLLAARGAIRIAGRTSWGIRGRTVAGIVLVLASSSSFWAGLARDFRDPATREVLVPLPGEREAWEALASMPEGGVLCLPRTALWVPGQSGQPVFVGQWFLSTRFGEKDRLVRWFYQGPATEAQRRGFLEAAGIRYLLHGPREREALGEVPVVPGVIRRWEGPGGWTVWEVENRGAAAADGGES
ncbi:hypothetical protein KBD49_12480 [Myxococcota bacterium]|nr:hypothetical protein [Myxococcota bacterium]